MILRRLFAIIMIVVAVRMLTTGPASKAEGPDDDQPTVSQPNTFPANIMRMKMLPVRKKPW